MPPAVAGPLAGHHQPGHAHRRAVGGLAQLGGGEHAGRQAGAHQRHQVPAGGEADGLVVGEGALEAARARAAGGPGPAGIGRAQLHAPRAPARGARQRPRAPRASPAAARRRRRRRPPPARAGRAARGAGRRARPGRPCRGRGRRPRARPPAARRPPGAPRARSRGRSARRRPPRCRSRSRAADAGRQHAHAAPLGVAHQGGGGVEAHRLGVQQRGQELGRVAPAQPRALVGQHGEGRRVGLGEAEVREADELA